MIYPTINDLSKDQYNRYEIALATAKCARMITNEYVRQRKEAERAGAGAKDGEKPLTNMIDREVRDEKAVKIAIGRINRGDFDIVHKDPEEQEREERAILEGIMQAQEPYYFNPDALGEDDEGEDGDEGEDEESVADEVEEDTQADAEEEEEDAFDSDEA